MVTVENWLLGLGRALEAGRLHVTPLSLLLLRYTLPGEQGIGGGGASGRKMGLSGCWVCTPIATLLNWILLLDGLSQGTPSLMQPTAPPAHLLRCGTS